jgi:hypothetical protein
LRLGRSPSERDPRGLGRPSRAKPLDSYKSPLLPQPLAGPAPEGRDQVRPEGQRRVSRSQDREGGCQDAATGDRSPRASPKNASRTSGWLPGAASRARTSPRPGPPGQEHDKGAPHVQPRAPRANKPATDSSPRYQRPITSGSSRRLVILGLWQISARLPEGAAREEGKWRPSHVSAGLVRGLLSHSYTSRAAADRMAAIGHCSRYQYDSK